MRLKKNRTCKFEYIFRFCYVQKKKMFGLSYMRLYMVNILLLSYISPQASKEDLPYPGWALAVLVTLIIVAFLPVPIGYLHSLLLDRLGQSPADAEARYEPCATTDTDLTPLDTLHPLLEENHHSRSPNGHIESVQSSVL